MNHLFLPISKKDMKARGWDDYDFLYVTGDAYVDHPSFGTAIISRVLESAGYRVAILAQPNWKNTQDFLKLGRPKLGVLVSAGNIDSMVAHYTVSKKKRHDDCYSPGNKHGLRPDRATIVYGNKIREAFGDIPMIIGGLEASLRRFAHYDYWEDKVRRSILLDSQADILSYGMGERVIIEIANLLKSGTPISEITHVKGTAVLVDRPNLCQYPWIECASYEKVNENKKEYAKANIIQYREHDPIIGKGIVQKHGDKYLLVNPPAMPLTQDELDRAAELPYVREPHPVYDSAGSVPAIEEVRFSVIHNRGCFGACNFCSLAFHQGRVISSRSHDSVIREVSALTKHEGFKGYIHDVGGPTANFRKPSCEKQLKHGLCTHRECLTPTPCKNLNTDHTDYLMLLRKLRKIPKIKKIFIRSGIRYDFLMQDKSGEFFTDLVQHHISGQLKVAPEHCVSSTLDYMGKPPVDVYEKFKEKYDRLNKRYEKKQFLVPYMISSHPGCTLSDGVKLGEWLNRSGHMPQQVQDFYPTPGTLSTCMYHTEIDPRTMKPVYVPKTVKEKAMQRALMQWRKPENRPLVLQALKEAHREDLIGFGKASLITPRQDKNKNSYSKKTSDAKTERKKSSGNNQKKRGTEVNQKKERSPSVSRKGWAKSKPQEKKKRVRG
ncbi:MAG: YgiQ family radical SAM protein [Eubacteriales bacterium]